MTHTHDRLRHGQAGAVGMMIIVWLAVVVVVGVAAIDAGSIAFTKFRLADVASTADRPTAAIAVWNSEPTVIPKAEATPLRVPSVMLRPRI